MNHSSALLAFALSIAVAPLATAQEPHVRPAVFQDLDFATALARSSAENKLLIVDAMTSWCGPCKAMDKTTWVDDELVGLDQTQHAESAYQA